MNLRLAGKTALVTGASGGLGSVIAKGLAAEGVKLCITGRRGEVLRQLAKEIVSVGGLQPQIAIVDIVEEGAPQKLAQEALRSMERIDILVNCAGAAGPMPLDAPEEKWVETMTLNFTRVRQLTLAMVPHMIKNKWGRIINITGSSEPTGLQSAVSPKAALHGFAKGVSREIAKHGITVNSLAPGRMNTEHTQNRYSEGYNKEFTAQEIPIGRLGDPEELMYLVVCLASPLASYITGNVIYVDGGRHRFAFS